MGVTELGLFY